MINYSEKFVFGELFRECLSFDPEEFAYKMIVSYNKNYNEGKLEKKFEIKKEEKKTIFENKLLALVDKYKFYALEENPENKISIEKELTTERENYLRCVDSNCFPVNIKKIPITKFNYYVACECVKICLINNYKI
jgi:hypothetical protein